MDYNNLLKNKAALVTAGANGIGYAIAKKFEESGAKVFVCDINQDAVDMVNKNHQNIKAIFCDLSQTQMISSMVESAFDYLGHLNIIVNNAGIAGHVNVGNNITIGALTTVHQFCKLGDFCFVGMNTSINMDIPAYLKVAADPARVIGLNTVGMTRNGIEKESISLIKKAYKLVYKKNLKIN